MKILCFADQEPPKIKLPPESVERVKAAKDADGKPIWVAVPDDKGEIYVLRWK